MEDQHVDRTARRPPVEIWRGVPPHGSRLRAQSCERAGRTARPEREFARKSAAGKVRRQRAPRGEHHRSETEDRQDCADQRDEPEDAGAEMAFAFRADATTAWKRRPTNHKIGVDGPVGWDSIPTNRVGTESEPTLVAAPPREVE